MPESQEPSAPMTVAELVHLRRLQKYQKRRRIQVEERLQRLQTSCAVRARLTRGRHLLRNMLAEALSSDAKLDFATLFRSFHTIHKACDEYDEHLPSSILEGGHISKPVGGTPLDRISARARDVLVNFVSDIACDPEFLIDRLLSLSTVDLSRLSKCEPQKMLGQSVFGSRSSTSTRKTTESLRLGCPHDAPDSFQGLFRYDALSLLLQIVASGSSGQVSQKCQMQVWVNTCVRLLSEQKPGGEKFAAAVLTAWSPELELSGKHALETWLLSTIQEGDVLSRSSERYSFRTRVLRRDDASSDEHEADKFLDRSLGSLLDIIKNTTVTGLIPPSALQFGQKLVTGMRTSHKDRQAALFCMRWLFGYLTRIIRTPESQGLLLSYHVSANARRRILFEIANHLEKLAFTVSHTWNYPNMVNCRFLPDAEAIISLFQHTGNPDHSSCGPRDAICHIAEMPKMLTVCSAELVHLVCSLFPEKRSHTESGSGKPHLQSSASSVSGLSLFRNTTEDDTKSHLEAKCISPEGSFIILEKPHDTPNPIPVEYASGLSDPLKVFDLDCRAAELRRACNELIEMSGAGNGLPGCDPLCEEWIPFHLLTQDRLCLASKSYSAGTSPDEYGGYHPSDKTAHHGTSDVQQPHIETKDAICSLLDEFITAGGPHTFASKEIKQAMKEILNDGFNPIHGVNRHTFKATEAISGDQPRNCQPGNILAHFEKAATHCQQRGDYTRAHLYFRALRKYRPTGDRRELLSTLIHVSQGMQRSIRRSASVIADCQAQTDRLMVEQHQQLSILEGIIPTLDNLREKMWYVCDVKSTSQYEDLCRMVSALRTMELPPRANESTPQPLLRHRQGSQTLNHSVQLKADAATLGFLATLPAYGGPNKLSDTQVESTLNWMQSQCIENICRGEERLHRFCQELTKCVDIFVGESVVDNPVLWSSELFRGQQRTPNDHLHHHFDTHYFQNTAAERFQTSYSPHRPSSRSPDATFARQWSPPPSSSRPNSVHSVGSHISPWSVQDRFCSRSPTLTDDSSTTFWSPSSAEAQSPTSVTTLPSRTLSPSMSVRSVPSRSFYVEYDLVEFLRNLKRRLTSLLLSDFSSLFRCGSETDKAMWDTLGGREAAKHTLPFDGQLRGDHDTRDVEPSQTHDEGSDVRHAFDYRSAFSSLSRRFTVQPDPMVKLEVLSDIQVLLLTLEPMGRFESGPSPAGRSETLSLEPSVTIVSPHQSFADPGVFSHQRPLKGDNAAVLGFQRLFRDNLLRPKSLFRDLQYIASLVPSHTLDSTNQGRAFCNATFAAVSLKQNICQSMIETADNIISYHTCSRGHSYVTSVLQAERDSNTFSPVPPNSAAVASASAYTMADAAQLLQITAREGNIVAQRELATLYLTHPEIMGRVIAPFTKPQDVFKDGMVEVKGRKDVGKYDPLTMAVAQHWMELSAKGGDSLAAKYLKAKADPLISEG